MGKSARPHKGAHLRRLQQARVPFTPSNVSVDGFRLSPTKICAFPPRNSRRRGATDRSPWQRSGLEEVKHAGISFMGRIAKIFRRKRAS